MVGAALAITVNSEGGSGFGGGAGGQFAAGSHESQQVATASGLEAWAEDDGGPVSVTVTTTCGPRTGNGAIGAAYVRSTDRQNTEGRLDEHVYDSGVDGEPVIDRHTLDTCLVCPGIWPLFLDYNQNEVDNARNDFGQPKLVAMVERNFATAPADPWNLFFNFNFSANSQAAFDNGGKGGKLLTNDVLRRQVAVTSSIVYYHRPGPAGWVEPANILNPFWRATLAQPDVDDDLLDGNVRDALRTAGYVDQAALMDGLVRLGFKGFQ